MAAAKKLHHLNAWEKSPGHRPRATNPVTIPAGVAALEELLPGGGWPQAGLVEITVPDDHTDAMALLVPALARFGQQERWLGMLAPPCIPRARLLSDPAIDPLRLMQINPHPGRSDLWTLEQMLRSGHYSLVMAWPTCNTELVVRRLQQAAVAGNTLGIVLRYARFGRNVSTLGLRLRLEVTVDGTLLYLLDGQGERRSKLVVLDRAAG
jgi:cell division inhibitor SulA